MAVSGTARKLTGFVLVLGVAFGAAYAVGQVVGPVAAEPEPTAEHDDEEGGGHGDTHDDEPAGIPAGLLVSEDGRTLEVRGTGPRAATQQRFAFRILDDDGAAVTEFEPTHDELMHLIVARRDLSGFQHVHPTMAADGTWSVPLTFGAAGDYRVFADFQPSGRDEGVTLGADVAVAGAYQPRPLPEPALTSTVDGYRVTLGGTLTPGTTSKLTLTVDRGGEPVTDLQPYLAAYGHLIALRQGDLGYLHVHPDGEPGDGKTPPGPSIVFYVEVPTTGTYRLYLDFRHGDVVRTAEFTAVAAAHEEK